MEHEELDAGCGQNKAHLHYMGSGQGMDPENRKARLSIASDFSGTAHSFQGANLEAVIAECNDWSAMPSQKTSVDGVHVPHSYRDRTRTAYRSAVPPTNLPSGRFARSCFLSEVLAKINDL